MQKKEKLFKLVSVLFAGIFCVAVGFMVAGCSTIPSGIDVERSTRNATVGALLLIQPEARQQEYAAQALRLAEALYHIDAAALASPEAFNAWIVARLNIKDAELRRWALTLADVFISPVIVRVQGGESFARALQTIRAISTGITNGAMPFQKQQMAESSSANVNQ